MGLFDRLKPSKQTSPPEKEWTVKIECVTACSKAKAPTILLSTEAYAKIDAMMEEFRTLEWLGFLVGEHRGHEVAVHDLVIPVQEASASSCETKEPEPEGCVGVIHSHHSMGTFFSGTDRDSVNLNNPVSIVVSRREGRLEFKAVAKVQVDCGAWAVLDTQVRVAPSAADSQWLEEAKTNVRTRYSRPTVTVHTQPAAKGAGSKESARSGETRLVPVDVYYDKDTGELMYECPYCNGQGCVLCRHEGYLTEEEFYGEVEWMSRSYGRWPGPF